MYTSIKALSSSHNRVKKHRKYGRKSRPAKHRINQMCGQKNCNKLLDSRVYSEKLKAYVIRQGVV